MEPLTHDETLKILEGQTVAHLGVILDGAPHVTPMSYVTDGETVVFRTMAGEKLNAIRSNPSVCIEVSRFDEETGSWVSVIVKGTARLVDEPDVEQETISRLFDKYEHVMGSPLSRSGGLPPLGGAPQVVEVAIEAISGMSSGRGISARTKPGRL